MVVNMTYQSNQSFEEIDILKTLHRPSHQSKNLKFVNERE